jgi:phosphoglycerate dehydrogenase-like enzyme
LEKADKLQLIAHSAGSVAPYIGKEVYEKGIKVISGNMLFAESVAECVVALALSSLREIPYYSGMVRAGGWKSSNYFNEGLLDQTVGLVGFGMIAKQLIPMLKPFRNRIKVYAPDLTEELAKEYGVEPATLEEIFTTCKIISLHVPSIPETYHMIDRRLLKMIPDGTLFINTARGSVIDEQALIDELKTKRFKAALDVYEVEPLPVESELRTLENVLPMPHMGGPTIDRRRYVVLGIIDDINRFVKGEELKLEIKMEYGMKMTGGK